LHVTRMRSTGLSKLLEGVASLEFEQPEIQIGKLEPIRGKGVYTIEVGGLLKKAANPKPTFRRAAFFLGIKVCVSRILGD